MEGCLYEEDYLLLILCGFDTSSRMITEYFTFDGVQISLISGTTYQISYVSLPNIPQTYSVENIYNGLIFVKPKDYEVKLSNYKIEYDILDKVLPQTIKMKFKIADTASQIKFGSSYMSYLDLRHQKLSDNITDLNRCFANCGCVYCAYCNSGCILCCGICCP